MFGLGSTLAFRGARSGLPHNQIEKPRLFRGLAKLDSSGNRRCAWGWSLRRSPSPQPSPPGEGERWQGAGKFGRYGCSPRFFVFRFGGSRQPSPVVLPKYERMFFPLLGERDGVRGNGTYAVLAASALDSAPEDRPKGHMALSHSSFQASGFTAVADFSRKWAFQFLRGGRTRR